ncbi:hypothetical protein BS50DRAFT_166377 [Corynespora cassiicola Philippines]|uniref:Uncharacterized protein n=1 Tax=Corynespora cassiicola Philippines TaxID=1448308 RepID=A0A2T2P4X5_CORCC|nr:hypothetical protein BS50DRAFT_166377 [Corynespora cassiicola Philippines]
MATGFEPAGIILATLPLLINAIEHRDVGLQPLNTVLFKKKNKEMIQKAVNENSVLFRHCCEKMLSIAEVENIADLLARDNGDKVRDLWADPSMELRLRSAFGQNDFNVIQCRLIEIEGLINKLQTDSASLFKQAVKGVSQVKDVKLLGKAIVALKTVLDGESLSVVIGTAGTAWQNEIEDMKTTRTHLLNIHGCVDATWGCECKSEHVINFQCKNVEDDHLTIILAATSARPKSEPTKAPWVLRPLQISSHKATQSKKSKTTANDLCKSLEDQMTVSRLSTPSVSQDFFYRIKASTQLPDPKALVPLSDSLKRGSDSTISLRANHGHKVLLNTPRDRIAVGARLLMAVLQQHNAPWLPPI